MIVDENHEVAKSFINKITSLGFILPKGDYLNIVNKKLNEASKTKKLTIISPICPDYSYIQLDDHRYKYTFERLGDNVGLGGLRTIQLFPELDVFFKKHGIECQFKLGGGDFEGFDPESLKTLSISEEDFLSRVKTSLKRIKKKMPITIETFLISHKFGGKEKWLDEKNKTFCDLYDSRIGTMPIDPTYYQHTLKSRRDLYRSWYKDRSKDFMSQLNILLNQVAEYALMGKIFSNQFDSPLVIGLDHAAMMPFYWFYKKIPIIYTKPNYI